jgi:hypothetical protein
MLYFSRPKVRAFSEFNNIFEKKFQNDHHMFMIGNLTDIISTTCGFTITLKSK